VIFKLSLPSVEEKTLDKKFFAECCICDTRQIALCRVSKKDTRQKNSLPSVKNKTLGKELLCRVFSFTEGFLCGTRQSAAQKKHSAKNMTLSKEPNSSSAVSIINLICALSLFHTWTLIIYSFSSCLWRRPTGGTGPSEQIRRDVLVKVKMLKVDLI
jgi:hypothetical protein